MKLCSQLLIKFRDKIWDPSKPVLFSTPSPSNAKNRTWNATLPIIFGDETPKSLDQTPNGRLSISSSSVAVYRSPPKGNIKSLHTNGLRNPGTRPRAESPSTIGPSHRNIGGFSSSKPPKPRSLDSSKLRAKEKKQLETKPKQEQLRVDKDEQLKLKDAKEYVEKLRQAREQLFLLQKETETVIATAHDGLRHALDAKIKFQYEAACSEVDPFIDEAVDAILQSIDKKIIFQVQKDLLQIGFSSDEVRNLSLSKDASKLPLEYNGIFKQMAKIKHLSVIRPKKFNAYFQTWTNYIEGSGLLLRELDEHFDEIFDVMEGRRLQHLTFRRTRLNTNSLSEAISQTIAAFERLPMSESKRKLKPWLNGMGLFGRTFSGSLHFLRRIYRLRSYVERGQATSPRSLIFWCWVDLLECETIDWELTINTISNELKDTLKNSPYLENTLQQSRIVLSHTRYLLSLLHEISSLFVADEPGPGWRSTFSKFDVNTSNYYQSWLPFKTFYYRHILVDPYVQSLPGFRDMESNINNQVMLLKQIETLYRSLWSKQRAYWIRNNIPIDIQLKECSYQLMLKRIEGTEIGALGRLMENAKRWRFKIDQDIIKPLPSGVHRERRHAPRRIREEIKSINQKAIVGYQRTKSVKKPQIMSSKRIMTHHSEGRRKIRRLDSVSSTVKHVPVVRSLPHTVKYSINLTAKLPGYSRNRTNHQLDRSFSTSASSNIKEEELDLKHAAPVLSYKLDDALCRKAAEILHPDPVFFNHELFRGPENSAVVVHYCTKLDQSEQVAQKFLGEDVLGFDLEWVPNAKTTDSIKHNVSLIQLASPSRVALFHISSHYGDTVEKLLPPTLRHILESSHIIKTGVNILGDYTRLGKYLGVKAHGLIELSHLHNLTHKQCNSIGSISKRLVSLATLVKLHTGLPLSKDFNVRASNWRLSLNKKQTNYAANDAYAGIQVFYKLESKRLLMDSLPPRPPFAELQMAIPMPTSSDVDSDEENSNWSDTSSLSSIQLDENDDTSSDAESTLESQTSDQDSAPSPTIMTSSGILLFHSMRRGIPGPKASKKASQDELDKGWVTEESDVEDDDSNIDLNHINMDQPSEKTPSSMDSISDTSH
jgi:3'-5' exonuclease